MIKRGKIKSKKAQTVFGLSFEMIFSILLIIAFIALAIYVIYYFLNIKKCTEISMFIQDLQENVDEVWKASAKSQDFSQPLPSSIKYVCFADFDKQANNKQDIFFELERFSLKDATIFLYPTEKACNMPYYNLKHINIPKITDTENPYCIENNGKPVLKLSKDFYEPLVCINCENTIGSKNLITYSACKKADDENMCIGLDVAYDKGREKCCSEYELCC